MKRNNLEHKIRERIFQTGTHCEIIIMHPKTWQELKIEVFSSEGFEINRFDNSLLYRGIRVVRSLDIAEGIFEVI